MPQILSKLKSLCLAVATTMKPAASITTLVFSVTTMTNTAQAANMTEADLQNYAVTMTAAANSKNVSQVDRLVADEALVSVTRKGRVSTLNKSSYLKLLQRNWSKTSVYSYQMRLNNAVITGDQAKANIQTIEVLEEGGRMMRLVTDSRATFIKTDSGVVLSRAISQLTIEQH